MRGNDSPPARVSATLLRLLLLAPSLLACDPDRGVHGVPPSASAQRANTLDIAPPLPSSGRVLASASANLPSQPELRAGKACAPSLAAHSPKDARDSASLQRCQPLRTGQEKLSMRCGEEGRQIDRESRLMEAVPEFDDKTVERIGRVARLGASLGRSPRAFGLVGDSITVSEDFLRPFGEPGRRRVELGALATRELSLPGGSTVIEHFRGMGSAEMTMPPHNPFLAKRAALIGASADWAYANHPLSPLGELVSQASPALAVVTFGANDAAKSNNSPELIADKFEADLLQIIGALEAAGVVVVLSNEMRHAHQPGRHACPGDKPGASDWQVAVAQNANSVRAAEVACRLHLPFIDLRHALDGSTNSGLGPDGVHLSAHRRGAGVLTPEGFDCGYNVRNFVTLLALRKALPSVLASYDSAKK